MSDRILGAEQRCNFAYHVGPAHKPMGMHVPSKVVDPRTGVDDAPIIHDTSSPIRVQIWTYGDHEKDTRFFDRLLVGLEEVKTPHLEGRVAECVHRVLRMPIQTVHLAAELLAKVLRRIERVGQGSGTVRDPSGQMGYGMLSGAPGDGTEHIEGGGF